MKKKIMILLLVMGISTQTLGKIYQIPPALKQEVKQNLEIFNQNQSSADARFELAMSYAYTGQIEKGWDMLKSIPKYDANYAPKVLEKYGAAVKANPKDWKAHFKLAFGYYFSENKQGAVDSFKRALEIDPKNVWIMGFIGLVEGERGNTDVGIKWSKKALEIEPNATAIHFLLAEGYRRKGDYFGALSQMLTVGRLKSEEAIANRNEK